VLKAISIGAIYLTAGVVGIATVKGVRLELFFGYSITVISLRKLIRAWPLLFGLLDFRVYSPELSNCHYEPSQIGKPVKPEKYRHDKNNNQ